MRSVFPGFPPEGIQFLRALARHNEREWFQPRKPIFDAQVKQPMRQLVEAVNAAMAGFAPEYVTEPDKAIYRIYRDTRFSKDKTPYKDHIAASFPRRGTPQGAGYYFQVSPKQVGIGGGIYMPAPETLLAIRTHVAGHSQELRRITQARTVKQLFGALQGEQLSRAPKGFDPGHPAADLLRFKQFILYVELEPGLATGPELYAEIVKRFRAMRPFLEFLNASLGKSVQPSAFSDQLEPG
jgi:uncharacterized protein (TIGR02453 family)